MLRKKLSEQAITRLMIILTLLAPFGTWSHGAKHSYSTIVYSFVWVLRFFNGEFAVFQILNIVNIFTASVIGMFTIFFGIQVVNCIRGNASKWSVYLLGVLTLVIPIGLVIVTGIHDFLIFQGPIPIQLIVGVLLVRSVKIIDSPWDVVSDDQRISTGVTE